ncbi:MAG: hypothetical protein P8Y07_06880 [Gemmatimonadales bacterium]
MAGPFDRLTGEDDLQHERPITGEAVLVPGAHGLDHPLQRPGVHPGLPYGLQDGAGEDDGQRRLIVCVKRLGLPTAIP